MVAQQSGLVDSSDNEGLEFESTSFWQSGSSSRSAAPAKGVEFHWQYDFISFLGAAQRHTIDFVPIKWQPGLDNVGEGRTAEIREAMIDFQFNFAFKCIKHAQQDERRVFRDLISELVVLGHGPVRTHPNILRLEGICFDTTSSSDQVWPVLLFEKTECGDLERFADSEDGRKLTLGDRLKLCVNVGTAVKDLHAYGIIHGDLGPRNVLIFKDNMRHYIAKVSDFGYSTLDAGSNLVIMPRTRPWYAPEWHHRGFWVANALKMDIFSFGMLCFWFMFHDVRGFPSWDGLEETKFNDALIAMAEDFVKRSEELNAEHQINLCLFFRSTLGQQPSSRNVDFTNLLQHLSLDKHVGTETLDGLIQGTSGGTVEQIEAAMKNRIALLIPHFEIIPSAYQLYLADNRVRAHIRKSLEKRFSSQKLGDDDVQNTAFLLSFCYHIGFGVARDSAKSQSLLGQSGKQREALDAQINMLRDERLGLQFQAGIFQRTFGAGYLHEIDFDQRYSDHDSLSAIEDEYNREIMDLEIVLSNSNPLLLMVKSRLARIMSAHGLWRKCETLWRQVLDLSLKIYGSEHGNTLMSMGGLAAAYWNSGRFSEAETLERQVVEISIERFGPEHLDTLTRMSHLAATYREQGRWSDAEPLFAQVLKGREGKLGLEHPTTLTSMANLGWLYRYQGKWTEAENLESQVLATRKRVLGLDYPDTLASMMNLGCTYLENGRTSEAEDLFSQVMEKNSKSLGPEHPDTQSSMSHLASAFSSQGRYEEAEKLQEQAHVVSFRDLGPEHPDTLTNMNNLALTYRYQGRWNDAEKLLMQVRETRLKILGEKHPYTLLTLSHLALIYLDQGRIRDAEKLGSSILESKRVVLGHNHPDTLRSITFLASVYRDQGRRQEAEQLFNSVTEDYMLTFGPEHPETMGVKANLALLYVDQEKFLEANALLKTVADIQGKVLGPEHPTTLTMNANLALTKRCLGQLEEAEKLEVEILETTRRVLGPRHPDTLVSMSNLALTLTMQGKLKEAELVNRQTLKAALEVLGPEHPDSLVSMANLASALMDQDRWDEAKPLVAQALDTRKRVLGLEHPHTVTSALQWATILNHEGRLEALMESAAEV